MKKFYLTKIQPPMNFFSFVRKLTKENSYQFPKHFLNFRRQKKKQFLFSFFFELESRHHSFLIYIWSSIMSNIFFRTSDSWASFSDKTKKSKVKNLTENRCDNKSKCCYPSNTSHIFFLTSETKHVNNHALSPFLPKFFRPKIPKQK